MNYLLPCPSCGRNLTVAAGQAGQSVLCQCGQQVEVPSVRNLRQLQPAVEEQVVPLWTKRHGVLFIGAMLMLCSAAFAAVVWIYRPAPFIPPTISVDQNAVEQEVQSLSPAESLRRMTLIQSRLPDSFEDRLHSKAVPPFLEISAQPIVEFEAKGPMPLAEKQFRIVAQDASKYTSQLIGNRTIRETLTRWLKFAGIAFVVGLVIAVGAFLLPAAGASKKRVQRPQQSPQNTPARRR